MKTSYLKTQITTASLNFNMRTNIRNKSYKSLLPTRIAGTNRTNCCCLHSQHRRNKPYDSLLSTNTTRTNRTNHRSTCQALQMPQEDKRVAKALQPVSAPHPHLEQGKPLAKRLRNSIVTAADTTNTTNTLNARRSPLLPHMPFLTHMQLLALLPHMPLPLLRHMQLLPHMQAK